MQQAIIDDLVLVGIGASAGGLEALKALLPSLPATGNVAYVVVQHMDPQHHSLLASLLKKTTDIPVVEVENDLALEAGKIFTTPAGHNITVRDSRLVLSQTESEGGPTPNVDLFFTSLANHYEKRSIGIILSGTGKDGARGLQAIRAANGITLVQQPETARYDGMPKTAIGLGCVDLALSPEKLGQEIASILDTGTVSEPTSDNEINSGDLKRLITAIHEHTGYDFSDYKEATLHRRVWRRIAVLKLRNIANYLAYTKKTPAEYQELVKDVLISVTDFFRDPEAFEALGKELKRSLGSEDREPPFRVWIPGCSTGEEAYSLVILCAEILGQAFFNFDLQFYATDIDAENIAYARQGIYPLSSLEAISSERISKYFTHDEGFYRVIKPLRERIVFAKQDVIHDPPFARLQLIACRNLLIYFKPELQMKILETFHYVLNADGLLFLGKSESVFQCEGLFRPVSKKHKLFKKEQAAVRYPPHERRNFYSTYQRSHLGKVKAEKSKPSFGEIIDSAIASMFCPSAVLINNKTDLLFIKGEASKYFQLREGSLGASVIDLVNPEIRPALRSSIIRAQREGREVNCKRIRYNDPDAGNRYVDIRVRPLEATKEQGGLLVAAFSETAAPELVQAVEEADIDEKDRQRVIELEQELAAAYERLQTTVEELETSNQELQSLNEELQSSNEELQATNEEFETSNEELQATNEELNTVNQELQVKSQELSEANDDLENVFRRLDIPLVVIDKEMRIRRSTPTATWIFDIRPGEAGQVITNVGTRCTLPNFREHLDQVIATGKVIELTISGATRVYSSKFHPYHDEAETISGAILSFYDVTSSHRRQQEFQALAENAPDIVARFDMQMRHLYVNNAVEEYAGLEKEEFIGKTNRELGMPKDLCSLWEEEMRKPLLTQREHDFEFTFPSVDGRTSHFHARIVPEFSASGTISSLLLVSRDITEERNKLLELNDTLSSISDGFFSLDQDLRITYFNRAASKLLGRSPDEVLGEKIFGVFPEAAGSIFEKEYLAALRDKQPRNFETHFEVEPYTNWYNVRVFPKKNGISVYFQVTTSQHKTLLELERNKKILQAIIDNIPVMITTYDQRHHITLVNNAFEQITGWTQEEVNTVDVMAQCYPDPELRKKAAQYMEKGSTEWKEFPLTNKNGTTVDTVWSNVKLDDEFRIGIGLDISEKKLIEKNLREHQNVESLGTLAGGIAHDFNNILAVILGNAEIGLDAVDDFNPAKRSLEAIIQASRNAAELVKQILTFCRREQIKKVELDTPAVVREALNFARATIPTTIDISERISSDCGPILANKTYIHQIVVNLCTNAAHALTDEKGEISVELRQEQLADRDLVNEPAIDPGYFAVLTVADTGCGMSKQTMERIFEPYFTTKEVGKGSGMGLAVVHGIIKRSGGFIRVSSTEGKGTRFRVYFPIIPSRQHQQAAGGEQPQTGQALPNTHILFVDDDDGIVQLNQRLLHHAGYAVTAINDSERALQRFRKAPAAFDLIITDQTMPHLSGAELAKKALAIRADIPIILCTGHSAVIDEEQAKAIGIKAFLMKPTAREELLATIQEALNQQDKDSFPDQ
ncbi:chemotaxis protein CheB [Desulfogranum marinum]|uniref:chemotaxis protein CheB n=1 Tax=Desulfogranum marinum TaxID=453220 RepID=UPI0019623FF3|nr:chemotaxis protein CheB [Desulfogranum marinum]MBM9514033.1 PAS domain-containing protein [Desulfogranum marinum]